MNRDAINVMEGELLASSPSPHIRRGDTARTLMTDVIIALIPALVWGAVCFGLRALSVVLVSTVSAVLFEYLYERIRKMPVTVGDFSAAVTGLLLGLSLPASVPYFMPIVGAFFAVVVVKQFFRVGGRSLINPAIAARVFLYFWQGEMTMFTSPFVRLGIFASSADMADVVASATPLASLKNGNLPDISWVDLITGKCGGAIGEVSSLLLVLGGVYLLVRKVITWHIPVSMIGTVMLLTAVFPQNSDTAAFVFSEIFSGGLLLVAFFVATDYQTSPITSKGKLIYGALCGVIIVLMRYFSEYPCGVSFAIIIMNCLVGVIDKYTTPIAFGTIKRKIF